MANTTTKKAIRLPHGWNARLQAMTGCSQPTVTRVIHEGDVEHPVWTAYEQLLSEQLKAKAKSKERLAKAEQIRNELAA